MKTRKSRSKWIARVLVIVMLVTCLPVYQGREAKAEAISLALEYDFLPLDTRENCVAFARYMVPSLPHGLGSKAGKIAIINSYTPKAGVIAITHGNTSYGHVAYVESVNGDKITTLNGGWDKDKNHIGRRTSTPEEQGVIGYWYPNNINPQPVANASVKAVWADKYDTNMNAKSCVYNPRRQRITTIGIQVRDGNNIIGRKEEMMYSGGQYSTKENFWFDFNSELGLKLRPGHVYGWQMYADVGGTRYYTDWINDRTTGTEKPNKPIFSAAKTHYAVGDAVTVSWGADSCATGGYSLTLKQTKGGTYSQTLTTNSANATSLAFTLPSEGEYEITGFARGSENSDTAALNKTIVAHNPCNVRFVEYDKEGNENLLCEQTVKYGYAATAPMGVSRKGHTFVGWKGEYSSVTSDRTIVAQFKRNTYKVTFYDKDDNIIDTQSVLFEDDATAPNPPEPESGYVFAGWDNEDYKNVQGNVKVKACYVWKNENLPVVVEINSCEYKEDGYVVNYNIKNNPNNRTKGRAIFSLRTSTGKLINSTESDAFSLAKAEYRENLEMYIPYDGIATNVSVYIVDRCSSGIPYSQTVSYEIEREWSDWSAEDPGKDVEVEDRTEYRYRNLLTTTTRTSVNEGWDLAEKILDAAWNFNSWSGWSRTPYEANETSTTKREVEAADVSDNNGYTRNTYYYWKDPYKLAFSYYNEGGMIYYEYSQCTNDSQPKMYVYGSYNGQTTYRLNNNNYGYGVNFNSELWFLKNSTNIPATTHKEYRFRDGEKGYTYKWTKWDEWSDWMVEAIKATSSKDVETRKAYRYRAKMSDLEDNSGKEYTVKGTVDKALAGKEALIQVYKGDEPSDSNNEYVGKVTINEDGTFSHKFVCRQEISEKTGDYQVMMAIEGGDKPFYLETIEAPKPQYKVVFKDMDGNIIDTQTVKKGNSATAPKAPDVKNYSFVGWDFGVTNVNDNMEITAQYVKNKYSVAFVDWETKEVHTDVFDYGSPVTYPEIKDLEGYDFVNWTTPDGKEINTITENTILTANYKIKTYKVNFYDNNGSLLSSQNVKYSQDAVEPEVAEIDGMVFDGWNNYDFINVNSDVDVYPIYKYTETTENPTCDTKSGVFTESKKIHLYASEGAKIYYTTDGSMPTQASKVYDGELLISQNTYLQFIAAEPNKNTSEVQAVSFLVASGEDDDGALVVKKEKYKLDRGSEEKITYFLSHENPDIGVNFYSLDENIATVDEDGTVHANNVGTTQIFVSTKDNKYADYCEIDVSTTDIDVQSIVLNKTAVAGIADETIQMEATVYPENATEQGVDWYTDDSSIATVSEQGELKILKKGTTKLRAYSKSGNCIAECNVKGVSEFDDAKLQISSPYLFLNEKDQDRLYTYYDGADVSCKWESANEEVVTVDDTGLVTAKKAGYSVIVATAEDGTEITCMAIVGKEENGGNGEETPSVETPEVSGSPAPTATPIVTASPDPTGTPDTTAVPTPTKTPETPAPTKEPELPAKTSGPNYSEIIPPITQAPINPNVNNGQNKSDTNTSASKVTKTKRPSRVKGIKIKIKSRKKGYVMLKISWKKNKKASRTEIQYASKASFANSKKKFVLGPRNYISIFLKGKKTYYIRLRCKEGTVYSKWSNGKKLVLK